MAEMTQEELVQEVLDRVLQSSTGVEDLETVTSLSGVKSLPGEKDGKMVNVPLELIETQVEGGVTLRLLKQPGTRISHKGSPTMCGPDVCRFGM